MTKFTEYTSEQLYDGEVPLGDVSVEIDGENLRSGYDEDFLHIVKRLERAAKQELQAVQDELDEDGEVSADE